MVRFEDTDPRPLPNGNIPCAVEPIFTPSRGIQRRGDVSPGFARQRAERQRAADEESKPDRLGLAALTSPHKPPAPEG